jgi:hypothetical protein
MESRAGHFLSPVHPIFRNYLAQSVNEQTLFDGGMKRQASYLASGYNDLADVLLVAKKQRKPNNGKRNRRSGP